MQLVNKLFSFTGTTVVVQYVCRVRPRPAELTGFIGFAESNRFVNQFKSSIIIDSGQGWNWFES